MTNDTSNQIETLQFEDVEMKVNNTLFHGCDRLKALAIK
jgi:hypothetical protein